MMSQHTRTYSNCNGGTHPLNKALLNANEFRECVIAFGAALTPSQRALTAQAGRCGSRFCERADRPHPRSRTLNWFMTNPNTHGDGDDDARMPRIATHRNACSASVYLNIAPVQPWPSYIYSTRIELKCRRNRRQS